MRQAILGADPGAGGALALFVRSEREFKPGDVDIQLLVVDTPVYVMNGKRRIDIYALGRLVREWDAQHGIGHAIVENVGAMPGQSPNGMFAFVFSAGALQMAVASAGIPMTLVVPQVWKKTYGIPGGRENKDFARQKASMIFPAFAHLWERKKDDGRAEAALLAHYGSWRTMGAS